MQYLCFDIGGTITKYAIINGKFQILLFKTEDTVADGNEIIKRLISIITNLKTKYKLKGIAIATGGVIDYKKGEVIHANANIINYTGLNLKQTIEDTFDIKTSVENDVNCFALAETKTTHHDFLMLTIGTGIGGAIVVNQQVYHGNNFRAGEFGQIVINEKTFENLASIKALVTQAKQEGLDVKSGLDVFYFSDQKNKTAIDIISSFYHNLALGILNLIYIFNPKSVIIGGGITKRETFLQELMIYINNLKDSDYFDKTIIKIANYNDKGGLIGALVHHLQ